MTECSQCQTASTRLHCGVYNFACAPCCARLVATTKPDKRIAAAMLEAIARFKKSPHRSEILGLLSDKALALHSARKSCSTVLTLESSAVSF